MNGILVVDKPQGFTSFDVIAKLRGILKLKRIGHTGTLDPMATGVLPCMLGSATRLCDRMPQEDKRYTAQFRLGLSTDTQDITGKPLRVVHSAVTQQQLLAVLPAFRGEITQLPPMYSAISVNGQRLYDLARQGLEVERPSRQITLYALELLSFNPETQEGTLDIHCSKGSYVRTLVQDIGDTLGVGGTLTALRRTMAGGFLLEQCQTLEQIAAAPRVLPASALFEHLPALQTGDWQQKMLANGVALNIDKFNFPASGRYTIWNGSCFLGVYAVEEASPFIKLIYKE